MFKKLLVLTAVLVLFGATNAFALTFYTDRASWETAVGSFTDFDLDSQVANGAYIAAGAQLHADEGGVSFDQQLQGLQVGSGWATWSGGQTPRVLYTLGATSVTGAFFDGSPESLGFEMEPNPWGLHSMILALNGTDLIGSTSLAQDVEGSAGAKFFGWVSSPSEKINSMTLSSADCDFAFGRIVYGTHGTVTPEPASLSLLGLGLLGLLRRKKA